MWLVCAVPDAADLLDDDGGSSSEATSCANGAFLKAEDAVRCTDFALAHSWIQLLLVCQLC